MHSRREENIICPCLQAWIYCISKPNHLYLWRGFIGSNLNTFFASKTALESLFCPYFEIICSNMQSFVLIFLCKLYICIITACNKLQYQILFHNFHKELKFHQVNLETVCQSPKLPMWFISHKTVCSPLPVWKNTMYFVFHISSFW